MNAISRTKARTSTSRIVPGSRPTVLVVEDSKTFTTVLVHRFREEVGADVIVCNTLQSFREAFNEAGGGFRLAVVDLNLADSPNREALDFAVQSGVPTIVFTGTFDFNTREKILRKNVLDYVIKDNEGAFDDIVLAVRRVLANRNVRVLVAEQGQDSESVLVEMLEAQQFLVVHASSVKETETLLREFPDIELIMIENELDQGAGIEFVKKIRRTHSSDQLRVIGVSSAQNPLLSAAFLKAGASDFLYKPFLQEEFQIRVAQNIDTLSQIKKLKAIASRDFLTDMYNRRFFFERGPALVKHCLARGEPCCAVVLDIDHFKKFNDVYGHDTGDIVLKTVARKIREMVDEDFHLTARMGGEEFAILLQNMSVKEATEYCNEIREVIGNTRIIDKDEELSVNVSMGLAEILEDETFDNYLHAADQYLYMAKNSGRNCVFSDYSIMQLFSKRNEEKAANG